MIRFGILVVCLTMLFVLLLAMEPSIKSQTALYARSVREPLQPAATQLPQSWTERVDIAPQQQIVVGKASIERPIPRTGSQPLLVILVDFPDRTGLFTGEVWHEFFFGKEGFSSYYREVSYDKLRYFGEVVGIDEEGKPVRNSDAVAYVRLPHPLTYYADGSYGFDVSGGQFPQNHGGVVTHALQALDEAGFNFSPYADSSTEEVENLIVIFAGSSYAYTRDAVNSLEATAYRLAFAGGGTYHSRDGQRFDNYTFCPDQFGNLSGERARIGVCAHEHGHALGVPDLYDFSYTTTGVGNFDLMAYGTFGATDGTRPFHFGAFSKEFLGWSQPTIISSQIATVTLGPTAEENNILKLVPFGNEESPEYFLLENRQPVGFEQEWEAAGLCAGLIIWHVDQAIVEKYPYAVNTLTSMGGPPHPGVSVMEADGGFHMIQPPLNYGDCMDTWQPGQRWHDQDKAGAKLWDGQESGLAVTVLSADNGQLTLRIENRGLPVRAFLPFVTR